MQSKEQQHTRFVVTIFWWAIILLSAITVAIPKGNDVLWVNGNHTLWLDDFFKLITHLGEGWIFISVLLFSLFIRFSLSVSILAMAALHGLICAFAKRVLFSNGFLRPAAIIDHQFLYFVPGVDVHSYHSFPSGHAATIFCFAVVASLIIRNRTATVFFLLIAIATGYSRIYLLQHFLMDVTAGALIGVSSALFVMYLFDRIQLPSWSSRGLQLSIKKV